VESRKLTYPDRPNWRISSTLFYHINSDVILKPLGQFETEEINLKYPAMTAGQQVQNELQMLKLMKN